MLDLVYMSFIAASIVTGLVFLKASSHVSYKLLLVFLIVTLSNEVLCYFLKKALINTHFFYNLYYYFRFPFLGLIFYRLLYPNKFFVWFIVSFFILTVVLFFICLRLYGGLYKLHTIYLLSGGIFVIALCLLYLLSLLRSDEVINPLQTPFFWTSTGLLFYFLAVLPFLGVLNFLVKKDIIFASQYLILTKIMSLILYSLIAIDFYIQWKQVKLKYLSM